mmetsp:Transcript_9341/g.19856  ORF Transcript_9341/g.19856 Transcript_9341/m.19856 type:complete len:392 (-) Transcript_9341:257-1432(-)
MNTPISNSDINTTSNIMRASHFGNPLITSAAGSNIHHHMAPHSPAGSTVSKNENDNTLKHEQLMMVQGQCQPLRRRTTSRGSSSSLNMSYSEEDPPSMFSPAFCSSIPHPPLHVAATENSMLLGSTIGLPSKYPGNSGHDRNQSLESTVLEELQDFEEYFGRSSISSEPYSDSKNKNNRNCRHSRNDVCGDENATKEHPLSTIQNKYQNYDADDDLYTLSRSAIGLGLGDAQSRESFHHRSRNHITENNVSDDEYGCDGNNATTHQFLSRIQNEHQSYDGDDDLVTLFRSQTGHGDSRSRESFLHSRSVSKMPSTSSRTSLTTPSLSRNPPPEISENTKRKGNTTSNRSTNHHHHSSSPSQISSSTPKGHRRSRNLAMPSSIFGTVLDQIY